MSNNDKSLLPYDRIFKEINLIIDHEFPKESISAVANTLGLLLYSYCSPHAEEMMRGICENLIKYGNEL